MVKPKQRILIPVDFSKGSVKATDFGIRLARMLEGEIELLHVVEPFPAASPLDGLNVTGELDPAQMISERGRKLEAWARRFKEAGITVRAHLAKGHPAEIIVEFAHDRHVDHIVMGTHSRHGLERLVRASVAREVVEHAPCPVTTIREEREVAEPAPASLDRRQQAQE